MSLDKATVVRIAHLARLKIPEERLSSLAVELNNILEWIELLSEVDTEDVKPMTSVVDMEAPRRVDEVTDGGYPEKILANAPESADGYFVVPKVIE